MLSDLIEPTASVLPEAALVIDRFSCAAIAAEIDGSEHELRAQKPKLEPTRPASLRLPGPLERLMLFGLGV